MLPPLDEAAKQRLRRFVGAAAMLWYTRKTITSLHENHAQLRLQSAHQGDSDGSLAGRVLRYTFMGQLISSMEYLIPLVKPVLAVRIARLLAGQGRDVVSNLEYGPHPRNMLDLYGTGSHVRRRPVVLFVHGGAWSFGHKWQYGLVGHYLAKHGFLVGVINYRTYPTGNVQDQVQDVEAAVRWLVDHAEEYGGDRDRIFVSGHSSGAHVTALALAQSAMREGEPTSSATVGSLLHRQVQGFIGLAGPYDIAEHFVFEANRKVGPFDGVHEISSMKPAMLGEDKFDECSPTRLFQDIRASDVMLPSFHIIHGNADEVVPASSSRKLADSLRQSGHHAEYIELDGCTHEDILFAAMGDNVASKPELVAHYKRIAQIDAFPPTPSVSLPLLAKL